MKYLVILPFALMLFTSCNALKLVKLMKKGEVARKDFFFVVPCETRMGLLIVKAEINGKSYDFLVDTGAPNVISKELAAELGLKPKVSQTTRDSQGQSDKLDFVVIDSISLNGLTFLNTGAAVADLKQSNEIACLDVDGFIGANLMRNAVWQIDYDAETFTIASSKDQLIIPDHKITVPFKPAASGTPKIDIEYNDVTEHNVTFDTGSNGSFGAKKATYDAILKDSSGVKHNFGVGRNASGLYGNNKGDTTWYAEVFAGMGNATFGGQLAKFSAMQSSILGNEFLKAFKVIIDWSEQEIYLIQNEQPEADDLKNFGFSPSRNGDKLLVSYLINNSSAEKSGLRIGDRILSINGIDHSVLTDELWCSLIYNGIADKEAEYVTVEAERDGVKTVYNLEKKEILE